MLSAGVAEKSKLSRKICLTKPLKISGKRQFAKKWTRTKNTPTSECVPDDEWLNRFVDDAKYVSDEHLQQVFGRLLKEKIFNPQGVNKRVLRILRDLDASELGTIQEYMSCFLQDAIPTAVMDDFEFGLNMLVGNRPRSPILP